MANASALSKSTFRMNYHERCGIWDTWRPGMPDEWRSFSVMTTEAKSLMSKIHDGMPVILGRSDEDASLDPEQEALQKL
jgi:putative SOS response-associated peptidase YedK